MEKFASVNFFNEFSFGATYGPEMLVKYANFVKIQPLAPDKRERPKASNFLVILIEPLSLKYYRSESATPLRLENLRKHT